MILADGNIGIGGDPHRLLRRTAQLLADDGQVLVEVDPPGRGLHTGVVRLEHPRGTTAWFRWATVGVDALAQVAGDARLSVRQVWSEPDTRDVTRWFAALAKVDLPSRPRRARPRA